MKIVNFIKNIWLFRKNLYNYAWYGGEYSILPWIKTSVDDMSSKMEKYGHEVEEERFKKIEKMKRLSYLIDVFLEDKLREVVEQELNIKYEFKYDFVPVDESETTFRMVSNETPVQELNNAKIRKRVLELEKQYWEELWSIMKGPDYIRWRKDGKSWEEWYDGTDIRNWWD
jgi:hypothetical protein